MPIYRRWTALAVALVAPFAVAAGRLPGKPTIAVVPVTLNNLSPLPDTRADSDATVQLGHEARARLGYCGYPVAADTTMPPAAVGHAPSYLFEHPDVAAEWGAAQHADWVLVSRLNRINQWNAAWEVLVISTHDQRGADTHVIELKGVGRDAGLSTPMATRSAAWLIDQSLQSVAHASGDTSNAGRPCHA
jgi:hypothetical protein